MAGSYSKIFIQVVFAVQFRKRLIQADWEEELYKYIAGTIKNFDQLPIAINGMPDHIHILFAMKPACRLSDLVREIKKSSNAFINDQKLQGEVFAWQNGYAAFSYSESAVPSVVRYIENQKAHHSKVSFQNEYKKFLKDFNVDYNEKYLFDFAE